MKKTHKKRVDDTMAAITKKPSVFVIKTTKDKEADLYKKLNEARMSADFVEKCRQTSKKLRNNSGI